MHWLDNLSIPPKIGSAGLPFGRFDDIAMVLSQLKAGQTGRIKGFSGSELELKLMEMGCIPGEEIRVEQVAPLGDPISVRIAGYSLSLRRNEAAQIVLED